MSDVSAAASRQSQIVNARIQATSVTVVGLGTIGSWLVPLLVKLGVPRIKVWDFDVVEHGNCAVQAYGFRHVGMPKVQAVRLVVSEQYGEVMMDSADRFEEPEPEQFDVVASCVDTWVARRQVLDWALASGSHHLLDGRISGRLSTVLAVDLAHPAGVEVFRKGLGTEKDDIRNEQERVCGLTGTAYVGAFTAARLCGIINNIVNGEPLPAESTYAMPAHQHISIED